ncbi:MAG: scaffold protein [Microviridae sp. ctITQ3]|nr:MAG: scaffold protein [Microviridae sp. ctITQ3]
MSIQKRKRVQTVIEGASMTQQQFKNLCDINQIMKKYENTGMVTHLNSRQGTYGDFSQVKNFQENLNMVMHAQAAFDSLPAAIRKKFANDPSQLLEFVQDDSNYDEAVKLGLVLPKPDSQSAPNDDETTITQDPLPQA